MTSHFPLATITAMKILSQFDSLIDDYDAFLFDLWGVIHDGEHLYPGVLPMLEGLAAANKQIVFLSNAPRLAASVIRKLSDLGVSRGWYHDALTSGEAAHRYLQTMPPRRYFYQGLDSDAALLQGIPQQRVSTVEEADFILNGNFDFHGQPIEKILPRLRLAQENRLPMICINPDLEVVKQDGSRIQCAGYIAAQYEALGGKVEYIGKPHPLVYYYAQEMLGNPPLSRILMVGDNLLTDILGGNQAGIATLLMTQGVLQQELSEGESLEQRCQTLGITPNYVLASFGEKA